MEKIGAHDECDAPHQPDHDASGGLSRIFSGPVGCFHCHGRLSTIQTNLHAKRADLPWTVDASTLPFAALLLTAGTLGDRYGRKRLFLAGLVLFLLGSMLCGFATTLDWFLIQALGQAFVDALHGSFVISGTALLAAALLVVFLQKPKQRSTSGE